MYRISPVIVGKSISHEKKKAENFPHSHEKTINKCLKGSLETDNVFSNVGEPSPQ